MGTSTFTGPIKAGDVLNTTGTTAGTIKNVGFVEMAQTASITQAGTATVASTGIVIPAYSHILNIQFLTSVVFNGVDLTISIGTTTATTDLVVAQSLGTLGLVSSGPGADGPRTLKWTNVGASDVIIYAKSVNTGTGVTDIIVRYLQAENA